MKPKIVFSTLPKKNWWGTGTPAYENNWAMKEGIIPNQQKVVTEHSSCLATLDKHTELSIIPFPQLFDTDGMNKHDFIFIRDGFISNQKGSIVISNFREKNRQPEANYVKDHILHKKIKKHTLPQDAYAEGGEFYYSPQEDILFAGTSRNNSKGVQEVARLLDIQTVCIVETHSFHIDTICTIILDTKGFLCGVIACMELIQNKDHVRDFLKKHHIPLIEIDPIDTIGFDGNGKISVNCLATPGVLIGGSVFHTEGVEEKIAGLGIEHIVTPITQFLYSGGGVHCLTNELFYEAN